MAVAYSKLFFENDIDYLAVGSFAPQCSWLNKVELRMAQLSRLMAGTILRHDIHGSHLRGKVTIDEELEKKSFAAAGNSLAELWIKGKYDGHPINARYVERNGDPEDRYECRDEEWIIKHCRFVRVSCSSLLCPSPCPSPFLYAAQFRIKCIHRYSSRERIRSHGMYCLGQRAGTIYPA